MTDSTPRSGAARYLRKLSHGVAGARTGAVEAATVEALSGQRADDALDQAIQSIEAETGKPLDASARAELGELFLKDGKRAIEQLKQAGVGARLAPREEDALEAIVELDGSRPSLAISADDRVDVDAKGLGQWRGVTKKFRDQIKAVASAVGRIDLDGAHVGTGHVVKQGFVLTNRHVLQELATQQGAGKWVFKGEPTITFDAKPEETRERQFKIKKVVLAGPKAIDPELVDYRKLDFAILECEPGAAFPAPLFLESDADKIEVGRPVFTIGYPAQPAYDVYESEVLRKLFRYRYGVKRFSPGEIDRGFGQNEDGETVFAHDATTLGGNSGSCVVDFGNDGQLVVGLHFAGVPKEANYAHASALLRGKLGDLGLTWKEWV